MVNDVEARNAVRQLMKRLDDISAVAGGMAYVLARRDLKEYAQLLKAAEIAEKTVIQPLHEADKQYNQVYAALNDPDADWSKAVAAMLNRGPIVFAGQQAIDQLELTHGLDEQFDHAMRETDGTSGQEERRD